MNSTLQASIRRHIDTAAPPLTIDEVVGTRSAEDVPISLGRVDRAPRARLGLVAAAGLVAVGSLAVYATATAPDDREQHAELAADDDPAWYRAIAPALPEGFESVAVDASNEWYVRFVAFDPADGRSLRLTVSRVAIEPDPSGAITLDQALATPAGRPLELLDITLPDGRQVSASCSSNLTSCPPDGPGGISPLELRDLVLHLATSVDPEDLPAPATVLDHVPVADIRTVTEGIVVLPEIAVLEAPHYAVSFVQYADVPDEFVEGDLESALVVSTVTGHHPALPRSTSIGRSDTEDGTMQWVVAADGVLWMVTDTTRTDPSVGRRVLEAVMASVPS